MKAVFRGFSVLIALAVTGCANITNSAMGQNSVLVNEVVTICGAIVGDQAEQRINKEWAKYPGLEANRPIIETMAKVLLTNPQATSQQRTQDHRRYLSCTTGLLLANGIVK